MVLKERLTTTPVSIISARYGKLIVYANSYGIGLGKVLMYNVNVVSYASGKSNLMR